MGTVQGPDAGEGISNLQHNLPELGAGLLERDGVFILAGYVVFVAGVFFYIFLGEAATSLVQTLIEWVRS